MKTSLTLLAVCLLSGAFTPVRATVLIGSAQVDRFEQRIDEGNVSIDSDMAQSFTDGNVQVRLSGGVGSNSYLFGESRVGVGNDPHVLGVLTELQVQTGSDETPPPPQNVRVLDKYRVSVSAGFADHLFISSATPHHDVDIALFFILKGGPASSVGGNPGADASLTAQATVRLDSNIVRTETGSTQNGDNSELGIFGGGDPSGYPFTIHIGIFDLNSTPQVFYLNAALSMFGSVTKYFACNAKGTFELDLDSVLVSFTDGGFDDVQVVGLSGFDYRKVGKSPITPANGGNYGGPGVILVGGNATAAERPTKIKITPNSPGTEARADFHLSVDGTAFNPTGHLDAIGPILFGSNNADNIHLKRRGKPDLILSAELKQNGTTYTIEGSIAEVGTSRTWTFTAAHGIYTSKPDPDPPFINVPSDLLGKFTVLFKPAPGGPAGTGWGTLTVKPNGNVTLAGKLADGTPISASGPLLEGATWPFTIPLYHEKGILSGVATFRDTAGVSDLDALSTDWLRPAIPGPRYPAGWPTGIKTDLIGSKYTATAAPILTGLGAADTVNGNARFTASGGGLLDTDPADADPATPLSKLLNIMSNNSLTVLAPGSDHLTARLHADLGTLTGSITHNATQRAAKFKGVVFQKQHSAAGYFLGPAESGPIGVTPLP